MGGVPRGWKEKGACCWLSCFRFWGCCRGRILRHAALDVQDRGGLIRVEVCSRGSRRGGPAVLDDTFIHDLPPELWEIVTGGAVAPYDRMLVEGRPKSVKRPFYGRGRGNVVDLGDGTRARLRDGGVRRR